MISAVAARKAAQAARQQHEQPTSVAQPPPPSTPPQSPKRKPSSQQIRLQKKRKRELNLQSKNGNSSSNTDIFSAQKDVIVIESTEDGDADDGVLVSNDFGSDIEILSSPPAHLQKRAWSPSIPLHDSSEDEDMDGNAQVAPELVIELPARLARTLDINIGQTLSTYAPVSGQNIYHLSCQDIQKMGLQNSMSAGTVVALEHGEKLCILGTCKLILLQGAVTVNGAPLRPSKDPHAIFAPRSSPLPVIQSRASVKPSATHPIDVSFLPQTHSTLVLLQELQSNVRDLGRVCRTFDGVYEPSIGRQIESMSAPLRVPGLYLVGVFDRT